MLFRVVIELTGVIKVPVPVILPLLASKVSGIVRFCALPMMPSTSSVSVLAMINGVFTLKASLPVTWNMPSPAITLPKLNACTVLSFSEKVVPVSISMVPVLISCELIISVPVLTLIVPELINAAVARLVLKGPLSLKLLALLKVPVPVIEPEPLILALKVPLLNRVTAVISTLELVQLSVPWLSQSTVFSRVLPRVDVELAGVVKVPEPVIVALLARKVSEMVKFCALPIMPSTSSVSVFPKTNGVFTEKVSLPVTWKIPKPTTTLPASNACVELPFSEKVVPVAILIVPVLVNGAWILRVAALTLIVPELLRAAVDMLVVLGPLSLNALALVKLPVPVIDPVPPILTLKLPLLVKVPAVIVIFEPVQLMMP